MALHRSSDFLKLKLKHKWMPYISARALNEQTTVEFYCIDCDRNVSRNKSEIWTQCIDCKDWFHQNCAIRLWSIQDEAMCDVCELFK